MGFPPSATAISDVARALCVLAHPDDVDFGAAGTVTRWVDEGIEVSYLLVTRGDAGGFDDDTPRERVPEIREAEQRTAAAAVGSSRWSSCRGTATARSRRHCSCAATSPRRSDGYARTGYSPTRRCGAGSVSPARATPTTLPSARPPPARSTRTPATRTPSPNCAPNNGYRPGPSARSGTRPGRPGSLRRRHRHVPTQARRAAGARVPDRPPARPGRHAPAAPERDRSRRRPARGPPRRGVHDHQHRLTSPAAARDDRRDGGRSRSGAELDASPPQRDREQGTCPDQ